jgi:hypothetical protein
VRGVQAGLFLSRRCAVPPLWHLWQAPLCELCTTSFSSFATLDAAAPCRLPEHAAKRARAILSRTSLPCGAGAAARAAGLAHTLRETPPTVATTSVGPSPGGMVLRSGKVLSFGTRSERLLALAAATASPTSPIPPPASPAPARRSRGASRKRRWRLKRRSARLAANSATPAAEGPQLAARAAAALALRRAEAAAAPAPQPAALQALLAHAAAARALRRPAGRAVAARGRHATGTGSQPPLYRAAAAAAAPTLTAARRIGSAGASSLVHAGPRPPGPEPGTQPGTRHTAGAAAASAAAPRPPAIAPPPSKPSAPQPAASAAPACPFPPLQLAAARNAAALALRRPRPNPANSPAPSASQTAAQPTKPRPKQHFNTAPQSLHTVPHMDAPLAFARPASAHSGGLQLQQQLWLAGYARGPRPWSRRPPRPAFPPANRQPTPTSPPLGAQRRDDTSLCTLSEGLRDTNPFARLADDAHTGEVEDRVGSVVTAGSSWKQVVVGSKSVVGSSKVAPV